MHKNEQKNKLLYTLSPPLMRGRCPSLDFYSGNDYNPTTNGNPCKILFRTPVLPPPFLVITVLTYPGSFYRKAGWFPKRVGKITEGEF